MITYPDWSRKNSFKAAIYGFFPIGLAPWRMLSITQDNLHPPILVG